MKSLLLKTLSRRLACKIPPNMHVCIPESDTRLVLPKMHMADPCQTEYQPSCYHGLLYILQIEKLSTNSAHSKALLALRAKKSSGCTHMREGTQTLMRFALVKGGALRDAL